MPPTLLLLELKVLNLSGQISVTIIMQPVLKNELLANQTTQKHKPKIIKPENNIDWYNEDYQQIYMFQPM